MLKKRIISEAFKACDGKSILHDKPEKNYSNMLRLSIIPK